jgi:hypothetical protein
MSDLVQRYGEKIMATYAANLAFFKEKLPAFYKAVTTADPGVRIDATIEEDGRLNFTLDGHPLPLGTLLDQAKESMQMFDADDQRAIVEIRHSDQLPSTGPDPIDEEHKQYFFSYIDFEARGEIDTAFVKHCGQAKATQHPGFGKAVVPIVIVFGSGYGSHLVELLDRYYIRHLIIVDNDPAITRLSLGFTDYVAIFNNHLLRSGVKFTMLCSSDPEVLTTEINQAIAMHWPPFFIHGIGIFRNLRNIALCDEVEKRLSETLWLQYRGWGFFDDELLSIRDTVPSLHARRPFLKVTKPVDDHAVAFVVANGPSLDGLAEQLRAHAGRALVISCGTALSALHRLGIVPDYHIEIERTYATVESIQYVVPQDFLAKVRVIAPSAVHPDVFRGAAEGLVVLKHGDTAGSVFPEECERITTYPTVANGAVSLLLHLGFQNIYLFGVDLGARDPKRHHSSHSLYFRPDEMPEDSTLTKLLFSPEMEKMGMEAEGNFGGMVSTFDIMTLARHSLERELAAKGESVHVYNLNDGALIRGAEPLRPEAFEMPADASDKAAVVQQVRDNFVPLEDFDAGAFLDAIKNNLAALIGELKTDLAVEVADKMALVEKISRIHHTVSMGISKNPPAYWALRGSLLHHQRRIFDYMTYIGDEAAAVAFAEEAFEATSRFLDKVLAELDKIDVTNATLPLLPVQVRDVNARRSPEAAA